MLLVCVLFALVTVGIVVPCAIDAATSPPWAVRNLARRDWLLVIVVCSIFGCMAWLIGGRRRRRPHGSRGGISAPPGWPGPRSGNLLGALPGDGRLRARPARPRRRRRVPDGAGAPYPRLPRRPLAPAGLP